MDIPSDDGAVVDHVTQVGAARQDVLDVLRTPATGRVGAVDVGAGRRGDAFAGEPLGDAHPPVHAVDVVAEDALHGLEGGPRFVGDDEALAPRAAVDGVAVGRVSVLPEAFLGLAPHATDDVLREFFGVSLVQPREDRADQFGDGLVSCVGLGEGHHADFGIVERGEGSKAVEHISGNATHGPHVEAVDRRGGVLLLGVAGVALGLGTHDQAQVGLAVLGGASADPLVDKPIFGRDDDAVGARALQDFLALLLDGLVLAWVRAAEVGGTEDGHGGLQVRRSS